MGPTHSYPQVVFEVLCYLRRQPLSQPDDLGVAIEVVVVETSPAAAVRDAELQAGGTGHHIDDVGRRHPRAEYADVRTGEPEVLCLRLESTVGVPRGQSELVAFRAARAVPLLRPAVLAYQQLHTQLCGISVKPPGSFCQGVAAARAWPPSSEIFCRDEDVVVFAAVTRIDSRITWRVLSGVVLTASPIEWLPGPRRQQSRPVHGHGFPSFDSTLRKNALSPPYGRAGVARPCTHLLVSDRGHHATSRRSIDGKLPAESCSQSRKASVASTSLRL